MEWYQAGELVNHERNNCKELYIFQRKENIFIHCAFTKILHFKAQKNSNSWIVEKQLDQILKK